MRRVGGMFVKCMNTRIGQVNVRFIDDRRRRRSDRSSRGNRARRVLCRLGHGTAPWRPPGQLAVGAQLTPEHVRIASRVAD